MKKTISIILCFVSIFTFIIPANALNSPTIDGSLAPPPSPNASELTASYSIMRSYADVTSVFIDSTSLPASAEVNESLLSYYPTTMYSTPNSLVSPSSNGFGDITDYYRAIYLQSSLTLYDLNNSSETLIYPDLPLISKYGQVLNAYIYSTNLAVDDSQYCYQYGTVTGEWIDGSSADTIVSGYAIERTNSMRGYTVTVMGTLLYGYEGQVIDTVTIDRSYDVTRNGRFTFNPQSLLEYEDTINFDYYVFTGSWTVYATTNGHLVEYKAYDALNVETFDYLNGYNEYTEQSYSVDLNPITRIVSKLSTTKQTPSGTLRRTVSENGEFTYDVSQYSQFVLNTDVPQEILEEVNSFNWLFGAVNGVLQMEIMPNFTLGGILLFIAGLALLIWILKIFLGG